MKRFLKIFLAASVLCVSSGCGGGGGGGDDGDSGSNDPLDLNACSTIGLVPKIIDGQACSEKNSPIARLVLRTGSKAYLCSGALIARDWVLTAAHCYTTSAISSTEVEVGGQTASATEVFIHPEAREERDAYFHDMALVHLNRSLSVSPLSLLTSRGIEQDNIVAVYGFGQDDNKNQGNLGSGRMRVDSADSNHIAATYEIGESEPCFGDSGGPLVYSYSADGATRVGVVGVVSTGTSAECTTGDYNLFTNVQSSSSLNFIKSHVPNVSER